LLFNIDRARKAMEKQGFDFLVSTTSENVLYTSDICWFNTDVSQKLFPMVTLIPYETDLEPTLIAPKSLCSCTTPDSTWIRDVRHYGEFKFATADKEATLSPTERKYLDIVQGRGTDRFKLLQEVLEQKASRQARIAVDVYDPAFPKEYSWKQAPEILTEVRMIKTDEEIERMMHAFRISEETVNVLLEGLRKNERQSVITRMIEESIASQGGHAVVIDIAMGRSGGMVYAPHPEYRARRGELVKYDCMMTYKFYCSDLSRMISVGLPDSYSRQLFEAMSSVGDRIIEIAKPGIRTSELFSEGMRTARDKLSDFDAQNLGHGLGITFREPPMIELADETLLEPGMIVVVETPHFVVGRFGFNMEDPILITVNGCKRISTLPRELFIA